MRRNHRPPAKPKFTRTAPRLGGFRYLFDDEGLMALARHVVRIAIGSVQRNPDLNGKAPLRSSLGEHRGVVGGRNGADDGESEAMGPSLGSVRSGRNAPPAAVPVLSHTRPPGTLWRTALSIRLRTRRSARAASPAAGAGSISRCRSARRGTPSFEHRIPFLPLAALSSNGSTNWISQRTANRARTNGWQPSVVIATELRIIRR